MIENQIFTFMVFLLIVVVITILFSKKRYKKERIIFVLKDTNGHINFEYDNVTGILFWLDKIYIYHETGNYVKRQNVSILNRKLFIGYMVK